MKKMLTLLLLILLSCPLYSQINNTAYRDSNWGLNFVHKASIVATRSSEVGNVGKTMPVTFNVTELPTSCCKIVKAFVWSVVSYTSQTPNDVRVTVTNPSGAASSFLTSRTGQQGTKCWTILGEIGTRGYRADVTNAITGNGEYKVSINTGDEMTDGLTLIIFYRDLTVRDYMGYALILDGLITTSNVYLLGTLDYFCADTPYNAYAFLIASDIQANGGSGVDLILNDSTYSCQRNFWNSEAFRTNKVEVGNNSKTYGVNVYGTNDCFSWEMMGIYFRYNKTRNIFLTANKTTICRGEGVEISVTNGELCEWSSVPPGFSSNASKITVYPATTTKYILKSYAEGGCFVQYDTVTINVLPAPQAFAGQDTSGCPGIIITIGDTARGGTPPYRFSWNPPVSLTNPNSPVAKVQVGTSTKYTLTVVDANGCVGTDNVNVNIFPAPDVRIVSNKLTSICPCDSVTLDAGYFSNSQYYWYYPNDNKLISRERIITVKQGGIYHVKVVNEHGCIGEDWINVRIIPYPVIKSRDYNLCKGDSVTLDIKVTGEAPFRFKWYPSYGLSSSNIQKPIASPDSTTTYIVTVTDNYGCMSRDTLTVYVFENPIADAGKDTIICPGAKVVIGNKAKKGKPPYKYSWYPSTELDRTDTPQVTASPSRNTTYFLTVTDSNGCISHDAVYVNISTPPKTNIKAYPSNIICLGDSATLVIDPYNKKYKYLWSTGETTYEITVKKSGKIYLTTENEYGCTGLDSIDITVHDKPGVKISADKPLNFCKGDSVILTAETQSPNCSFNWSTGGAGKSIIVKESGSYFVRAINEYGCIDYDTIHIKITGELDVKIEGDTATCGDNTLLKATPVGSGYLYLWSTGETTSEITAGKSGRYWVKVSLGNSCEGSDTIDIKLFPKPSVKILGVLSICKDKEISLSTDESFNKYLWSTGETSRTIKIVKGGKYNVTVIDSNGCVASDSVEIIEKSIGISGLADMDFGKICNGGETYKELIIRNEGADKAIIKDIRLKDNSVFTLDSYSKILAPGQSENLKVHFKPDTIGYYKDSIIIEFSEPCIIEYKAGLKATAYAKTLTSLPVITAEVGEKINIPLSLKLICGDSLPADAIYKTNIIMDASALYPDKSSQDAGVQINGLSGDNVSFSITSHADTGKSIKGMVLLARTDSIPLIIDGFKWNNDLIENENQNGMLILKGKCQRGLSRTMFLQSTYVDIVPNPASEEAEIRITGEKKGKVELSFYTLEGIKKKEVVIDKSSFAVSGKIILDDYGQGLYQVVAKLNDDIVYSRLIIVK